MCLADERHMRAVGLGRHLVGVCVGRRHQRDEYQQNRREQPGAVRPAERRWQRGDGGEPGRHQRPAGCPGVAALPLLLPNLIAQPLLGRQQLLGRGEDCAGNRGALVAVLRIGGVQSAVLFGQGGLQLLYLFRRDLARIVGLVGGVSGGIGHMSSTQGVGGGADAECNSCFRQIVPEVLTFSAEEGMGRPNRVR
ncbi:hypothetical protein [Actinomadura keratinilytica]|uniref:hypothetical protein n=1 Tax=Actinomadura keratinilytica TaxID=547461 RepID=UPI003622A587